MQPTRGREMSPEIMLSSCSITLYKPQYQISNTDKPSSFVCDFHLFVNFFNPLRTQKLFFCEIGCSCSWVYLDHYLVLTQFQVVPLSNRLYFGLMSTKQDIQHCSTIPTSPLTPNLSPLGFQLSVNITAHTYQLLGTKPLVTSDIPSHPHSIHHHILSTHHSSADPVRCSSMDMQISWPFSTSITTTMAWQPTLPGTLHQLQVHTSSAFTTGLNDRTCN